MRDILIEIQGPYRIARKKKIMMQSFFRTSKNSMKIERKRAEDEGVLMQRSPIFR